MLCQIVDYPTLQRRLNLYTSRSNISIIIVGFVASYYDAQEHNHAIVTRI